MQLDWIKIGEFQGLFHSVSCPVARFTDVKKRQVTKPCYLQFFFMNIQEIRISLH